MLRVGLDHAPPMPPRNIMPIVDLFRADSALIGHRHYPVAAERASMGFLFLQVLQVLEVFA